MLNKILLVILAAVSVSCAGGEEEDSWVQRDDIWDRESGLLASFESLFLVKKVDESFLQMEAPNGIWSNEKLVGDFVEKFPDLGEWAVYRKGDDFSGYFLVDDESNVLAIYVPPFVVMNIYDERFDSGMDKTTVMSEIQKYILNMEGSELQLRDQKNKIFTNADTTDVFYEKDFRLSIIAQAGDGYISIGFLSVREDDSVIPTLDLQNNTKFIEELASGEKRSKPTRPAVNDP